MPNAHPHLLDFDEALMIQWLAERGYPSYRANQIIQWAHQRFCLDIETMTTLPKNLKADLKASFRTELPQVLSEKVADDGTVKWLFSSGKGNAVETVFIPEDDRGTLCVSSQIGCALACTFCSTGDQGFNRSLSTSEILSQLHTAHHQLKAMNYPAEKPITNVVFMGMGEPLTNESALYPALHLLLNDHAYGLSKYRVTVSTSGIVPAIRRLKLESPCALAVSLHAASDELRNEIVPINKKYPLSLLKETCKDYFSKDSKRSIVFEYVMLDGVNDQITHAQALVHWLSDFTRCKVNLIPFNPYPKSRYQTSSPQQIKLFQSYLKQRKIITTIRKTRGENVLAACGQLAGLVQNRRPSHQLNVTLES